MEQQLNLRYEITNLAERFRHYVSVLDEMLETFSTEVKVHSNGKIKETQVFPEKKKRKYVKKPWQKTANGKKILLKNLKKARAAKKAKAKRIHLIEKD